MPKSLPGHSGVAATRLAALALGLFPVALACSRGPRAPSPVIVVTIDTLRQDRLGCYGYGRDTSPNLDRFAQEGVLFERAETTIATTLPAHVSLWTSRYPLQTGVVANDKNFNAESGSTPFFAEEMRRAGYRTAAFVSGTPVKRESGISVGFQVYDQPEEAQRKAGATTDRVLAWLKNQAREPFFLWIHYFDPHEPYEPPAPYDTAFATDDALLSYMRDRQFLGARNELVQLHNNQYDGEIKYVDSQIQRVFDQLKEMGLWDRATIVVLADHGEGLGQHNFFGHGRIYEEQVRIPMILKLPAGKGPKGERRSNLVSIVDVVPTLVHELGLPIDLTGAEGVDALSGVRTFDFAQRSFAPKKRRWGNGEKFCLTTDDWRYHHSTEGGDELYQLTTDPYELHNRVSGDRDVGKRMLEQLLALIARCSKSQTALQMLENLSPQTLKDLEKLGYTR